MYRFSLKEFPSVTDLLKSYEVGHRVKKASVFSPQQIEDMIVDPELTSRYWLVRKVICLIGYYGGLRSIELRSIEFGKTFESGEKSFDVDNAGYWFSFERGKQRGLPVVSSFCVPRRQVDWSAPILSSDRNPVDYDPASVIDLYLELVELDLKATREKLTGCFFKSAHGKNGKFFRNVPMGKNLIERVGREFAEELMLPHPETFTSHCWRRTCGTNASDRGVNVTSLMAFMGWKTPKTAIGYVAKSRLASYNMSLFLCNVQRQISDLDVILEKSMPRAVKSEAKNPAVKRVSKKPKGVVDPASLTSSTVGTSDSAASFVSSGFGSKLAFARKAESTVRTVEGQKVEDLNLSIVQSIEGEVYHEGSEINYDASELTESVTEGTLVVGGGHPDRVPGSGQLDGSGVSLDPRVGSILRNLQHNGELHLHFHFGNK
jgi:integrase